MKSVMIVLAMLFSVSAMAKGDNCKLKYGQYLMRYFTTGYVHVWTPYNTANEPELNESLGACIKMAQELAMSNYQVKMKYKKGTVTGKLHLVDERMNYKRQARDN